MVSSARVFQRANCRRSEPKSADRSSAEFTAVQRASAGSSVALLTRFATGFTFAMTTGLFFSGVGVVEAQTPPLNFLLVAPADGSVATYLDLLIWSQAIDLFGDPVTYSVVVNGEIWLSGLTNNFSEIGRNIVNEGWNSWRVVAENGSGFTLSNQFQFYFEPTFVLLPCFCGNVPVGVRDGGNPILDATVWVTPTGGGTSKVGVHVAEGIYVISDLAGSYTIQASVPGYPNPPPVIGVVVPDSGFSDPVVFDLGVGVACADSDFDGLSDCDELAAGTNPALWDTDGDGIGDGVEADDGTDPLNDMDFTLKTEVWVEIDRTGTEKGTLAEPVSTLGRAVGMVASAGAVKFKNSGNLPETPLIDAPMTLEATAGSVRIGDSGGRKSEDGPQSGFVSRN